MHVSLVPPALALLLAGCSTLDSLNPVTIYHRIEGGRIAEQRQPPPGSDAPDPNLSTVPSRPAPPDKNAMERLTRGLIADRENARYSNAQAPLPDPSSPTASPGLFGAGTLPPPVKPPPESAATASLAAATAPPAPPAPSAPPAADAPAPAPAAAPRKPVGSEALPPPDQPPATAAQVPPGTPAANPAQIPPLPSEPPPRPAAAPVAAPAPPAVVAPLPVAPVAAGTTGTPVSFDPGSAKLPPAEADALKTFALQRKGSPIAVIGYGDAVSSDPTAQAAALTLAVARAKAVADALVAAGVPAAAIQTGGEAAGRGAFVRLLK
jgi:outer membrane protein OmpA-like peptidoglycan-associated protein